MAKETFLLEELEEVDKSTSLAYHQPVATDSEVYAFCQILTPHSHFLQI